MKKIGDILGIIFILALLLVACGKTPEATTVQNPVTTQEPTTAVQNTPVSTKVAPSVPADVPIMPDAYDMEVPTNLNVTYRVKAEIKDVAAFYQQALPESGWDQMNNPDSVVGAMAQITRSNSNGDRISFSLQYNPVGEFTIVQIYITRAP